MNPMTLESLKLLHDLLGSNTLTQEQKEAASKLMSKLFSYMDTDIDAVIEKTKNIAEEMRNQNGKVKLLNR